MKKSYLIMAAIASLALVSCSDEEFVGEQNPGISGQGKTAEIVFGSIGKGMTRADLYGADAADKLNNKFVFLGTKSVPGANSTSTRSIVFDQYYANWKENTANTTESNSNDWEYVGYTPATTTSLPAGATQSIKYWDYSTTQYDFAAYSLGKGTGTSPSYAEATKIDFTNLGTNNGVYTITGTADELKACYISDLVTAYNQNSVSDYGNVVTFKFRSLATKIRIAFYETVPGYSVGDVMFYESADATTPTTTPTLYTSTAVLPSGSGTMTVSFPTTGFNSRPGGSAANTDYNKAHVKFTQAANTTAASTLTFDALADFAAAESKEELATSPAVPQTGFLGRSSNTATFAGGLTSGSGKYYTILPYEDGENLVLRIKYTLLSTDGSKESIVVDKATAVIPKELAKWSSNYAYTYIFKISDMTNGTTGVDQKTGNPVMGLTPITLNAVVVDSEDGIQETITTVSTPSITTYTQGQVVTANDEYLTGNKIYVIVNNGTSNVALTTSGNDAGAINAKLYTVTVQEGALQTITEESVDNAIRYGKYENNAYTVTDAADKKLVVTEASGLTASTKIAAEDSPTGNEITVDGAYFTAGDPGTIYAFQYRKVDADKTTYSEADANAYNEKLSGAISITSPDNSTGYSFTSYGDANGNTSYGTGKAKLVSQANGWTTVLVTKNDIAGFAGKQYKVQATTINANTYYQLYETNGAPTGIYVKVEAYTYTETDVNEYNATLPGAVSTSTIRPDAYGYKIIKIKK